MFRSIEISNKIFKKKPINFVLPTFYWVLLKIVYFLSLFAIIYFLFLGAAIVHTTIDKTIWILIFATAYFIFAYWDSGLKGSLIATYSSALHNKKSVFMEFFTSGKKYRTRIFIINLIRTVITLILFLPFILLYVYIPAISTISYSGIILGLIGLSIFVFISYLTYPAIILTAIKNIDVRRALRDGLKYIKRNPTESIVNYGLYLIIYAMNYIPLIDVITLFLIFPVIYSGLIMGMERR